MSSVSALSLADDTKVEPDALSPIEKRRVAGYIAPRVRSTEFPRQRPVKVVDKDGNVIREISLDDMHEKLRERAGIEFDVIPDPERCSAEGCLRKATGTSLSNARKRGHKAYCDDHKQIKVKHALKACYVCGQPSTRASSTASRSRPSGRAYCAAHASPKPRRPRMACTECGAPATKESSKRHYSCGYRPYCDKHCVYGDRNRPLLPCFVCGQDATRASSNSARSQIRCQKAYCTAHKGGRK